MTKIVRAVWYPSALKKIQLSEQTMDYVVSLRNYLPIKQSVKGVLLSVNVHHGNFPNAHAYLTFDAYQEDGDMNQKTNFWESTYNAYYTVHKQELIIPWNTVDHHLSRNLIINITNSYNTGSHANQGNANYFQIFLSGYIV